MSRLGDRLREIVSRAGWGELSIAEVGRLPDAPAPDNARVEVLRKARSMLAACRGAGRGSRKAAADFAVYCRLHDITLAEIDSWDDLPPPEPS